MQPEIIIELRQLAIITILVIGFCLWIGAHPFKKKQRLVIGNLATGSWQPAKKEEPELWTAGDYFTFLSSMVRSSPTLEELSETLPLIESFFDKPFRVPISNYQLKRYYARLLQVYYEREKELESIPVVMCKN